MNAPGHYRPIILCVDHEEVALEMRKRVLEMAGYEVLTATNPLKALELLRRKHVDLVLTEHIVTAFLGRTLAAIMKRLKPDVSIAIYSGDMKESPEDMRFADMFITKLVSIDELLDTIRKLLNRAPTRAAA